MYLLKGRNEDGEVDIALFDKKENAQKYIDDVTLEKFPNGNRRFRRDSELSCFGHAYVEVYEPPTKLPKNIKAPTSPARKEYIVVIEEGLTPFRINCGSNLTSANNEVEWARRRGLKALIEERLV